MADINNKPKLQLRSGLSFNGEKSPSPAPKLLINHGKPNFTIQRSPKIYHGNGNANDNGNPWSPSVNSASSAAPAAAPAPTLASAPASAPAPVKFSNEFVVKSTTFNGIFKPSNISKASQQSLQQNAQDDNEASKVVLRRAKVTTEPALKRNEDENVPEFIRRQRRIQERLAKENVLDFENRRSGYFTQVMISPSSPNRQSFVETMSSPAIVPGLEIPPPTAAVATATQREVDIDETPEEELKHEVSLEEAKSEGVVTAHQHISSNGHLDEEEVNRAIEEVNKAVAGEDDDKTLNEELNHEESSTVAVTTLEYVEQSTPKEIPVESAPVESVPVECATVKSVSLETSPVEATLVQTVVTASSLSQENCEPSVEADSHEVIQQNGNHEVEKTSSAHVTEEKLEKPQQNGHVEAVITSALPSEDQTAAKANGLTEEPLQNGDHSNGHASDHEITISHTNAMSSPSLPSPDPSGEKGVNYEAKTVVSFSQVLGSDINKYPDTVKVTKDVAAAEVKANEELKDLAKLKFEIKSDQKDIEVTPVLKVE